jgi:hypothetical protein
VRQLGVDFAVMKTGAAAADQLGGDGRHPRFSAAAKAAEISVGELTRRSEG